jgi:hypothetical protein
MAAFCGLSAPMNAVKRMSRLGRLAEGSSLAANILFAVVRDSALNRTIAVCGHPLQGSHQRAAASTMPPRQAAQAERPNPTTT